MDLPIKFPDPREEARKRGEAFQRLSSTDRWREMAAMMAFGWEMVRTSPRRTEIERRMRDQEDEWRRIQQEIFARYGG
jgi:phosphosulfolactate synthase (CoM biosynthesis protein A)